MQPSEPSTDPPAAAILDSSSNSPPQAPPTSTATSPTTAKPAARSPPAKASAKTPRRSPPAGSRARNPKGKLQFTGELTDGAPGEESLASIQRIFDKFDVNHNGVIEFDEVKTLLRSVQLFPATEKIREMIRRVDTKGDGIIDFEEFVNMRRKEEPCELNVLAQFKKFDVSDIYRGFITEESIRKVLEADRVEPIAIDDYVKEFMALDTNGDGKVSFLDLFESMMSRVPDEWLEWIWTNVQRGVADDTITAILRENGFQPRLAERLLARTKREGRQIVERSYVDMGRGYVKPIIS
ncbi:hypothetical protein PAPYR_1404 [Paratrimastix pyriformis]|uniref:EF-hand domain-containing protein n=1 Tax=Paratrimastix pyriformis TaxID=342808 RepID=A0ABQ8UUU8_9EUKA|nr:hypothetical protein PAPYR_1404 [Paratrimastix pyriformis]